MQLGFSHPVEYNLPEGISADTEPQTEIVITGVDKQRLDRFVQKFEAFGHPSPTRARVFDMQVST